jgi:GNAT superfamily N-acetyltransferase
VTGRRERSVVDRADGSPAAAAGSLAVVPLPVGYPAGLAGDRVTPDGRTVHLRPIRPDDHDRLIEFHRRLSPLSVYRRFFLAHPQLSQGEATRLTQVDYRSRLALVMVDDDRLLAVARYERIPGTTDAEVAFVVADELQHHGIGTMLLAQLAAAARRNGITAFVAQTLVDNHPMLAVFRGSGFPFTTTAEFDTVSVRLTIGSADSG